MFSGSISVSNATAYTFSVYAKRKDADWLNLSFYRGNVVSAYVNFNLLTGTKGTESGGGVGTITPVGNGWYRCTITATTEATSVNLQLYVLEAEIPFANAATVGTVKGMYVWGAQVEAGSFATSYIPTGASTVDRNADAANISTQAFPYSSTEGTMVVDATVLATTATNRSAFTLVSSDGYITIGNNVSGLGGTNADFYILPVGRFLVASGAVTAGTPFKAAGVYKANDFALSVNRSAAVTSSSGTLPTAATEARIGRSLSSLYFNGHIREISYLPRRVTNAELQQRTL